MYKLCKNCQKELIKGKSKYCSDICAQKQYYKDHRDIINERRRNNINRKIYNKKYSLEHKDAIRKREKINYQKHRTEIIKRKILYAVNRMKRDPIFKLRRNISSTIATSLRLRNSSKNGIAIFKVLGYTPEQLKNHLENLFKIGMTWENHGIFWHINHIIPHASFNYTSIYDKEFQECWKLDNLMPMDKEINLKLGSQFQHGKISAEEHAKLSIEYLNQRS